MKLRTLASGALSVVVVAVFGVCTLLDAEKFADAEGEPESASFDEDEAFTEDHEIDPLWDEYLND